MPIAHCYLSRRDDLDVDPGGLVDGWSKRAGVDAATMTINFIGCRQVGAAYRVMADLRLPSLWSDSQVSRIQEALAQALAEWLNAQPGDIHVTTNIVGSGRVVEDGKSVTW